MENNEMAGNTSAGVITFTPVDDMTVELKSRERDNIMPSVLCEYSMVVLKDTGDSNYVFTGPCN